MKSKTPQSIILTEIGFILFGLCLIALDIFLWPITGWYLERRRIVSDLIRWTLVIVLYTSSVFMWILYWQMMRLLRNLRTGRVFVKANVTCLRIAGYCCIAEGVACVAGGFFYMPLFFVAAAGLGVSLILRVLKNVFQQAAEMKDELDYTV